MTYTLNSVLAKSALVLFWATTRNRGDVTLDGYRSGGILHVPRPSGTAAFCLSSFFFGGEED